MFTRSGVKDVSNLETLVKESVEHPHPTSIPRKRINISCSMIYYHSKASTRGTEVGNNNCRCNSNVLISLDIRN